MINKIREILLTKWDPLDIGENPSLSDEYDGYIALILRSLIDGIGIDDLSMLLYKIEQVDLGINGNQERCYNTAIALKNIDS